MVNETASATHAGGPLDALRAKAPARHFACLFAPVSRRTALVNLHLLDLRLENAARDASELQIALIKLAWWRDALAELPDRAQSGEPLLTALADAEVPGWPPLLAALAEAHMDMAEGQEAGASGRGAALFRAAGRLLSEAGDPGSETYLTSAGEAWGRRERHTGPPADRSMRPITALARIADEKSRSPSREQLAIMAHILTGRL
ncbi:MAG: squalene/phytoene synthase family protein [Pacificimonas sp.]